MLKNIRLITIMILVIFTILLSGCDHSYDEDQGGENGDDSNGSRTFVFSDDYPYERKSDALIRDKQPNQVHTFYIYVINNGGNWKDNDVKNIKVTYYDITAGTSVSIPAGKINISGAGKHDPTYIRVQNFSYASSARGYFLIEAEIEQGNNHWYKKRVASNHFNYGTPPPPSPPVNKDDIIYEKEIVD